MVVRMWLVRHGETTWNAQGRFLGWHDPPLTARGRRQAERLRAELAGHDFAGVWSSDLSRAVETARLAWGEPREDRRLREMDLGALEGLTWAELSRELRSRLVAFEGFDAPGGETFADFASRVGAFVDDLIDGDHVVFTHGGVIRLLLRTWGTDQPIPPASVVVLEVPG